MEIHQCMTCGERWGVGTSASGLRAEQHRLKGHQVFIGDDQVLANAAKAAGLDVTTSVTEPMAVYRCLDDNEVWVHGTEDACDRAMEHKALGHLVYQGDEAAMRALTKDQIGQLPPQTPNPRDPASASGGGTVLSFGPG